MRVDIRPLLKLDYWFSSRPPAMGSAEASFLFIIFGIMFVVGTAIRLASSKGKHDRFTLRIIQRFSNMFSTMGILGVFLVFLTFEQIPFLGSRGWFLVWIIGFGVWLGFIIHDMVKRVPRERVEESERARRERYLPKRKK